MLLGWIVLAVLVTLVFAAPRAVEHVADRKSGYELEPDAPSVTGPIEKSGSPS